MTFFLPKKRTEDKTSGAEREHLHELDKNLLFRHDFRDWNRVIIVDCFHSLNQTGIVKQIVK